MASRLSSASQSELSAGTNALPSWSLIDTDVPAKGVVRIVRSSEIVAPNAEDAGTISATTRPISVPFRIARP